MNKSFGKYEIAERIGKGGMAEVFLAKSVGARGVEKTLVIKKILPELAQNERFIEMFISEAKIAMGLNHPNIVQIYDFGRVDTDYYLAMEYVDGFELGRLLKASQRVRQPLPIGDAVYLAMEAARGLDYAHRRCDSFGHSLELVHCDISPQNLLVSRDGALKIVDFGIAKATSVTDDGPDIVKGKYQYMSPEQAAGEELDHRSDLFSLGAVLFELVCGRTLFAGSNPEETLSLVSSAVVPDIKAINPEVPDQLEHMIYKALARDRDERVQNAREFQLELTRVLYGLSDIHDATTVAHHIEDVEVLLPDNSLEFMITPEDVSLESQTVRTRTARTFNSGGTPLLPTGRTPLLEDAVLHTGVSRQRKEVVVLAGQIGGITVEEAIDFEDRTPLFLAYQRIVESIAYKNDAVVHEIDASGFVLLLGIPISSENDAERAARMSLDLQEAVQGMSMALDPPLTISQGITIGEVILTHAMDQAERQYEWNFHGAGQELAVRLAQEAVLRQVLTDEQVYQRLRRNFRCKLHQKTDKGREIAPIYRMLGLKSPKDQIEELRRSFQTFYGREIPRRLLRDTFRQAMLKERAHAVLILGPTGVGKSTLVEKFLSGLNPNEVRVVRGIASPFDADVPLASAAALFSEMMRVDLGVTETELRSAIEARLQALFVQENEEYRWLLDSLFHVFGVSTPESKFDEISGEERRRRLFLTLSRLTNRFAKNRPLVLAIEDVHFIDPVMRAFTAQYFDRSQKAPVFFVGTARDAGVHLHSRSWNALVEARNMKIEYLGELAESDAEKMVRNRLQIHGSEDETLVKLVLERSGGNPLYIEEVVNVLQSQGVFEPRADLSLLLDSSDFLPASVEGLIGARFDRLELEERDALQRLSLLRSPFARSESRAVLGRHADDILDRLVEKEMLETIGAEVDQARTYRFANTLIQEVASRSLVPSEAKVLHRRIADQLLTMRGRHDGALIARHLDAAGESQRAIEMYIEALDQAFDQFGASECIRLCEQILDHEEVTDPQRFQVLMWRERSLGVLGEGEEAQATLEELEKLAPHYGSANDRAHLGVRRARYHFDRGQSELARESITNALKIARGASDRLMMAKAWRTEAILDLTEGRRDRALALIDRAIATLSMKTGEKVQEEMVGAYNMRGVILRQSGRHREALEAYETALAGAEAVESSTLIRQLLTNSGLALAYVGEFSEAKRRYQRALDAARRLGHRRDEALVLVNLGHVYQMIGLHEKAESHIRRGIYLARHTGDTTTVVDGQISLGLSHLEAGNLDKAQDLLQEGFSRAESLPHAYLAVCAMLGLAQMQLVSGSETGVRQSMLIAQNALERTEEAGMMWGVATAHELLARALLEIGEPEKALTHSRRAIDILEEVDIYGIDQILLTHAEVLPEGVEFDEERRITVERARQVYVQRRDAIDDAQDRHAYIHRSINKRIRRLATWLTEESEVEET